MMLCKRIVWMLTSGLIGMLVFDASYTTLASQITASTISVDIADTQYQLTYSIVGANIESISADPDTATTKIKIRSFDSGWLEIRLPGSYMTRVLSTGSYFDPIIFVDRLERIAEIHRGECDISMRIPFESGSEEIDIVGTFIYSPDFGAKGQQLSIRITAENKEFILDTVTNADACDFSFDQNERRFHAGLVGPISEEGYFQITLPHEFLGGPYNVMIDDRPIEFENVFSNVTDRDTTTISFLYDGENAASIDIIGTTAIPEFPYHAMLIISVVIGTIVTVSRTGLLARFCTYGS
jgi:hypothetical protein